MNALGNEYKNAEVKSGTDFTPLPAGGYVCVITGVKDVAAEKPYLEITYDIAEGEYTDYYSDDFGRANLWAHQTRQYYTPASMGVFKGFLRAIDESNGTAFEAEAEYGLNERQLVGRVVGFLIGQEWYNANDGTDKYNMKVVGTRNIKTIREGRYKEVQPRWRKGHSAPTDIPTTPSNESAPSFDDDVAAIFGA